MIYGVPAWVMGFLAGWGLADIIIAGFELISKYGN